MARKITQALANTINDVVGIVAYKLIQPLVVTWPDHMAGRRKVLRKLTSATAS